jgi:5'-AMP-activated protein kinase, regulatory gamma subunit
MADDAMDVEAPHASFGMDVETISPDPPPFDHNFVQNARKLVVAFLREHRAEEVVPESSRVVVIDASVKLSHAIRALLDNGIRAAPLVDIQSLKFVGMLTVSDIIDCLRHFYYSSPDRNVTRGLEEHTVASWRAISQSSDVQTGFRFADAESSLFDACRMLRDHRIHRLPIIYDRNLLLCTLEHWRILQFVHRHLGGHDGPYQPPAVNLFDLSLAQLGIGTYSDIITVRHSDTLLHVLETMSDRQLSAVPVVDDAMRLINVYSRTDITVLGRLGAGAINLDQPVSETLISVRSPEFSVDTIRRSDTLRVIFERFENSRKHRLYAVNEHRAVEGVISLSDLLAYFLEGF